MKNCHLLKGLTLLSFLFLLHCNSGQQNGPRKIEVLFLGHNSEHHNSAQYLPLLSAALAIKGVNFTYTDNPEDLNDEFLAPFDALMIYANHDSIGESQNTALLKFVKSGKGFLPIHSASYCFRNAEEYVELVGAQFKSHKVDSFPTKIVDANHPIMKGFEPFETWDETYVHDKHNNDRTVLMERAEGDSMEPWTWVRQYGKGRVFYTAYGHDQRTWSNPGFHDLLYRAIVWAVGQKVSDAHASLQMPVLSYVASDSIPNYERRDPPPQLQLPLDPPSSMALTQVPPGFELQLFAAEPDVIRPIFLSWDTKGRLWVIESVDYPHGLTEMGKGADRIKICEDTDGDGKADKFTIFADSLNIPTSLVFSNDGVVVSQAPHFLFLKDTDGDDVADERRIMFSGWGTFDTHAGPSNLKYGFDNHIWGAVGYSGFEDSLAAKPLKFGQAIYRMKPDGSDLEQIAQFTNNTWGLGFSETFDVFGSTANNEHSVYVGIPVRYFDAVKGLRPLGSKKIDGHYNMRTNTANVRQVDVFGGFTAAAGFNLYTARTYPEAYWNKVAFVCEPTGRLVHNAKLVGEGAGFLEKDGWNLLASADEWMAPVHAETGPDGSVWVADWYNFIVQHNPTPSGFLTGRGNAHLNPHRDNEHGRIYRIVYRKGKPSEQFDLNKDNPEELLKALASDNLFWRQHAQRLLVERGKTDVLDKLVGLASNMTVDGQGMNHTALHAIWTLHGLGAITQDKTEVWAAVTKALAHRAAGVRKSAVQALPKSQMAFEAMQHAKTFEDKDPQVRLSAFLALSEFPQEVEVARTIYTLCHQPEVLADDWHSRALYCAATKHIHNFLKIYKADPAREIPLPEEVKGIDAGWQVAGYDDQSWKAITVGRSFENADVKELEGFDGVVWHRTTVELPGGATGRSIIHLGRIFDNDIVWVNGVKVGESEDRQREPKSYNIPSGVLKNGKNVIAVRIDDPSRAGGIVGPDSLRFLQIGERRVPLPAEWKFSIEKTYYSSMPVFNPGHSIVAHILENYGEEAAAISSVSSPQDDETPLPADAVQVFLKPVKDQMKYDKIEFTVKAGQTVEIVFENIDAMQHNVLILQPESLYKVGPEADKMAQQTDAAQKHYVPDMAEVLFFTRMVNPGETVKLRFKAPDKPDWYPYVCTFPGHWRSMNGVMKVVKGDVN